MLRLLIVSMLVVVPALAQDADSERLRALTKTLPQLPLDRIPLNVNPPLVLEGTSAVAGDEKGNIYVLHRPPNGDPIVVVDRTGKLIRSWGKGLFHTPHGIRIDPAGNVWTVDAHTSMVYKFTAEGKKLLEISVGDVPDPSRPFCGATDVAFASNGHVYVADGYCNGRVLEYDASGTRVRQWGKHGAGPGEFNVPHGIAVSPQGHVFVADRGNGRLQWFDSRGTFLGEFKYGGELYNVTFTRAGELYVSTHVKGVPVETEFNMVTIDPSSGKMLGRLEVRAHQLSAAPDGTMLPGTRVNELLLFRPRK